MRFRPCIDIHNGKVKQIVGGSLQDAGDFALDNFVSDRDSSWYAAKFNSDGIKGAHVIILNSKDSDVFEQTQAAAINALKAYPGGLQIGGGINAGNAAQYIEAGASHVIVTSYVFSDGKINYDNLKALVSVVGKEHVVLDLSARRREDGYYVVTNRWQNFTEEKITTELFEKLSDYCDEFLVHGVDVEGKKSGFDEELIRILASANGTITYAGGISSYEDIETLDRMSEGRLDFTVGSALDLYGGQLSYEKLKNQYR